VLSVSVIANGGTTSCIGTSSSAASNLLFDGGTLQYTGTTASTDRNFSISDGKTAAFDITHGASDLTISGKVVTTTGGLSKTGLGTLTLSGSNAYTGTTSLLAGTLAAANKKALGSGNLTITGGTLQTAGGNRIIHLGDGNLSQDGGTIALTVGGPAAGLQSDLIKTRGTAAFNSGTLALTQASGHELLPGEKIRLVTADGGLTVGGATPPSTGTRLLAITVMGAEDFSNNPLLIAQVNAYRKSLVLEAAQGSFADLAGPFGFTPNQLAVARSLDSVAALHQNKTGLVSVLDILDTQPLDTLPASLDLIAPDELTSIFTLGTSLSGIQFSNLMGFMASIRDPEHSAKDAKGAIQSDERWETFLLASGSAASADSTSNASGFDLDTGGTTAGAGYRINDRIMIGGDVGYSETTASLVGRGRVRAEEWQLGLFGTYHDGGFHVDAAIGGGINHYKTHRDSLGGSASAEPDGSAFDLMLQTGYDWKFGPLTAGPTASVQYSDTRVSSFTEKGGLTPLDIHSEDGESIRSALGGRAFYDTKIAGLAIRPELHASWQHEYGDTSYSLTSEFDTLGGAPFTVHGPELGRDSLLLGVGISVLYNERISSFISYDGELFRSNYSSNSISAGVRASF
jgi:autotransporter-associated beta strand protein